MIREVLNIFAAAPAPIDCDPNTGMNCDSLESIVPTVIGIAMWAIGIISVVMLIFGGIKYATSAGDEKKVASAKNTIIYAIVGLAVAILAWTLTNFVFKVFN